MSTDSRVCFARAGSRLYRLAALGLGVVSVGIFGAPCAFPLPATDYGNQYCVVAVSGTLPLEVRGQPAGGTFAWTGVR
jgi:hypothetical protein